MTTGLREVDVRVSGAGWPWSEEEAAMIVRDMLEAARKQIGDLQQGVLEVWFASDKDLQALNRQYRGKDAPTNVLSFPAAGQLPVGAGLVFGQLALANGVCAQEAASRGITLGGHIRHLILHGLLHLQGYDHETKEDAEKMEKIETMVMQGLGLHDPYALLEGDHVKE